MKKLSIIAGLLLFTVLAAWAQDVKFTATASKVVEVGERFRLVFEVNARGSGFKSPDLKDFSVLSGPASSSSSSVQIVNGNVTQSVSNSYTYIVSARKEGKFTIDPATITVNGKSYTSNSLTIEVIKGNTSTAQGNSQQQQNTGGNSEVVPADDLFARIYLDKKKVYIGQPVVATMKIYTRINLSGIEDVKLPSFKGFYSQDLNSPDRISLQRENVDGAIYEAALIKRVLLYPQKTGELEIDPFVLECILSKRVRPRSFFDSGFRQFKHTLKSRKAKVTVLPLPEGAPESFNGAIGSFSLSVSADALEINQHDAVTLTVAVKGTGNLKLLEQPKIDFPPDFESYDPKVKENFRGSSNGEQGVKSYEFLLVARHAGEYVVPAVEFSYFDPSAKKYKTAVSKPITIKVNRSDVESSGPAAVQAYTKEQLKVLGSDIRYIKTGTLNLVRPSGYLFGSLLMWLLFIVPLACFIALVFVKRKQLAESRNIAMAKNKNASKISRKRLKLAHAYMKQDKKDEFYEELARALWGYIADKLMIPVADLNKDRVREKLLAKGIDEQTAANLLEIMNQCEFARFAPSAAASMDDLFHKAEESINSLEGKIK